MESLEKLSSLQLPDFKIVDADAAAKVSAFNTRASELMESANQLVADFEAAPTILAIEASKISERASKLRNRRAAILLASRDAWRNRLQILRDLETSLRDELESVIGELAEAESVAAQQLADCGITPSSLPAWHFDQKVAEHQFRLTHIARAKLVVDAHVRREQIEGNIRAVNELIEVSRVEAVRAAADLTAVIARELSIA